MCNNKKPFLCRIGIHKKRDIGFVANGIQVNSFSVCVRCEQYYVTAFMPPHNSHTIKITYTQLPEHIKNRVK